MMPKHKQFLQPKKSSDRKKNTSLESANEYLEAGVNFEESGEKWRAGDAAKSLRFFVRAIETYDAGLKNFPKSFDLAYNKARLQYDVAQQPRLAEHLPTPPIDLLHASLDSHRYALTIDQDNADLLFNTAQVLTSVAETTTEGKKLSDTNREYALRSFQESLELFQRCLNLQEFQFTQTAQEAQEMPDTDKADPNSLNNDASDGPDSEVWAAIIEPVTRDTLLDTCIAQMETLTAICVFESNRAQGGLAWIEEYYQYLLAKLGSDGIEGHRRHEAALAKANFVCALSEAAYRNGQVGLLTYEQELNFAFNSNPDLDLSDHPQGLCEKAEADLTFNASIEAELIAMNTVPAPEDLAQKNAMSWKHITRALNSLTAASKLPNAQNLSRIHLRRGDCELLRLRLGEHPTSYDLAKKSASILVNNASLYYQFARATLGRAPRISDAGDEGRESVVKGIVAAGLKDDQTRFLTLVNEAGKVAGPEIEELYDEGLLGGEGKVKILSMLA